MKHNIFGYILVIIGILSLLGNFNIIRGEYFLMMVGATFLLAFYFGSKKEQKPIGFLIPGCITMGVGIFSNIEGYLYDLDGPVFFWILGISFMAIHIIHKVSSNVSLQTKWALYVGAGLVAFGTFVLGTNFIHYAPVQLIMTNIWPVALILGGLWIIFKKRVKTEKVVIEEQREAE